MRNTFLRPAMNVYMLTLQHDSRAVPSLHAKSGFRLHTIGFPRVVMTEAQFITRDGFL